MYASCRDSFGTAANIGAYTRMTGIGVKVFQMMAKVNDLLLSLLTRHQFTEHGMVNLANQARGTSELTEQIKKMAESRGGGVGGKIKPVSKFKATQNIKGGTRRRLKTVGAETSSAPLNAQINQNR